MKMVAVKYKDKLKLGRAKKKKNVGSRENRDLSAVQEEDSDHNTD